MTGSKFVEAEGFARYWQDKESKGILVPEAVLKAVQAEAKAKAQDMTAQAATKESAPQPKHGGPPLPKIRVHTDWDISDALAYAQKLLQGVAAPVLVPAKFSKDLLTAIVLISAYETPNDGMGAVFFYLDDPAWDSAKQMLLSIRHSKGFTQKAAATWVRRFQTEHLNALLEGSEQELTKVVQAAKRHWSTALSMALATPQKTVGRKKPRPEPAPARVVQVFGPDNTEKAAETLREMSSEKRTAGARILEQARAGDGCRTLPDAREASKNLEAKKLHFENLQQPIERLQTDLVLAQAMPAQEFRIAPILLLGEPGIGKTYLAGQLAQALGVPSEKISAGGAQGAFQLSGSHSTWTSAKPGAVVTLLAQSASASPVLVVDEVDKIHEDKHAFLPVLLDLLDAGTAKRFRDEYFEMEFDASRIVVVLTANSIDKVPQPLLSRVEVFKVPAPEPAQRLRIMQKIMADLSEKTGHAIAFAPEAAERLADRMDVDLRQLERMVRAAFAMALQAGDKVARLKTPGAIGPVGFSLRDWAPQQGQPC